MPRKTRVATSVSSLATTSFNEAAARCRGKRKLPAAPRDLLQLASMRPRPDAAENDSDSRKVITEYTGFNEAAARCRGKPRVASATRLRRSRFNEAAARCRGKLQQSLFRASARTLCFNEAAARCRGKRSKRPCKH